MQDNNTLELEGSVQFTQSFITGSFAYYVVWIRGHNIQGRSYSVGLAHKCYGFNYHVNIIILIIIITSIIKL